MIGEGWAEQDRKVIHWLKLPECGTLLVQFLNDNFVYYTAHYVNRLMRICKGPECEYCRANIGRQLRYVFDTADVLSKTQYVFEVSESFAEKIRDLDNYDEGLSGRVFEISRLSGSKFSNMSIVEVSSEKAIDQTKFPRLDIKSILINQDIFLSLPYPTRSVEKKFNVPSDLRDVKEA